MRVLLVMNVHFVMIGLIVLIEFGQIQCRYHHYDKSGQVSRLQILSIVLLYCINLIYNFIL
jgi:hypothetical protein